MGDDRRGRPSGRSGEDTASASSHARRAFAVCPRAACPFLTRQIVPACSAARVPVQARRRYPRRWRPPVPILRTSPGDGKGHVPCSLGRRGRGRPANRARPPPLQSHRFQRRVLMNTDILMGKWKQLRGKVKEQWGELTDDELDKAEGRFDRLSGLLQERYGYAKDEADRTLNEAIDRWVASRTAPPARSRPAVILIAPRPGIGRGARPQAPARPGARAPCAARDGRPGSRPAPISAVLTSRRAELSLFKLERYGYPPGDSGAHRYRGGALPGPDPSAHRRNPPSPRPPQGPRCQLRHSRAHSVGGPSHHPPMSDRVLVVDDEEASRTRASKSPLHLGVPGRGGRGMAPRPSSRPLPFAPRSSSRISVMPGLDGLELLRALRDEVPTASVILLTGNRHRRDRGGGG